jgi:hypothetical protein
LQIGKGRQHFPNEKKWGTKLFVTRMMVVALYQQYFGRQIDSDLTIEQELSLIPFLQSK